MSIVEMVVGQSCGGVRRVFAAEGQVIGLKKKERKYKEIVRKLLSGQPLTDDERTFLKKEGVAAKKR
jgi:hypothetical protein